MVFFHLVCMYIHITNKFSTKPIWIIWGPIQGKSYFEMDNKDVFTCLSQNHSTLPLFFIKTILNIIWSSKQTALNFTSMKLLSSNGWEVELLGGRLKWDVVKAETWEMSSFRLGKIGHTRLKWPKWTCLLRVIAHMYAFYENVSDAPIQILS